MNAQPYDGRLDGHDDPDHVRQWGEIVAESMAERHYSACYDDPPCRGCIQDTPLEADRPEWAGYFTELSALVDAVERRVSDLDAEPTKTPRPWIYGAYYDAFLAAAVDPAACPHCGG